MMQLLGNNFALPSNGISFPTSRGNDSMKSTHHFRDQLSMISGWFEQWNECEQTVALYSLMQKIAPLHSRFLSFVLEQNLAQCLAELVLQEQKANDPAYINCLSNESKEVAVAQLLSHLPLLRPGNEEAKSQYLSLIPKILAHSVRHTVHIEESRQLLSFSLIHPAISNEDRRSLTLWLRQLEDRIHNYAPFSSPSTLSYGSSILSSSPSTLNGGGSIHSSPPQDNFSSNSSNTIGGSQFVSPAVGSQMDIWRSAPFCGLNGNLAVDVGGSNNYNVINGLGSNSLPPGIGSHHMTVHSMNSAPLSGISRPDGLHTLPMTHSRIRRSSSLTPPGSTQKGSRPPSSIDWNRDYSKQRDDHAPLSPQSSAASSGSGSESQKDDKDVFTQEGSGMKDVPSWLKSLRLHKYSYIFKNMEYEEMMSLTEAKLEKMNITKGARHKIVLSIQKLRERQSVIRSMEKDIQEGSETVKTALNELKSILQTPIKSMNYMCSQSYLESSSQSGGSDSSGSDPPSPPQTPCESDNDSAWVTEGDIAGQITRLMGRICSSLLITPHHEEESHNLFLMLIDKCLGHEAFIPLQKRRLFSWKQQIQKVCHPLPPRRSLDGRQNKGKWNGFNHSSPTHAQNAEFTAAPIGNSSLRRRMPVHYHQPAQRLPSMPHPVGCPIDFSPTQPLQRGSLSSVIKRPSLQDHMKPHVHIQRTNSAPVRPNPIPSSMFGKTLDAVESFLGATDNANDPEIIRLESLCLSVTEHAIGGLDGAVPIF